MAAALCAIKDCSTASPSKSKDGVDGAGNSGTSVVREAAGAPEFKSEWSAVTVFGVGRGNVVGGDEAAWAGASRTSVEGVAVVAGPLVSVAVVGCREEETNDFPTRIGADCVGLADASSGVGSAEGAGSSSCRSEFDTKSVASGVTVDNGAVRSARGRKAGGGEEAAVRVTTEGPGSAATIGAPGSRVATGAGIARSDWAKGSDAGAGASGVRVDNGAVRWARGRKAGGRDTAAVRVTTAGLGSAAAMGAPGSRVAAGAGIARSDWAKGSDAGAGASGVRVDNGAVRSASGRKAGGRDTAAVRVTTEGPGSAATIGAPGSRVVAGVGIARSDWAKGSDAGAGASGVRVDNGAVRSASGRKAGGRDTAAVRVTTAGLGSAAAMGAPDSRVAAGAGLGGSVAGPGVVFTAAGFGKAEEKKSDPRVGLSGLIVPSTAESTGKSFDMAEAAATGGVPGMVGAERAGSSAATEAEGTPCAKKSDTISVEPGIVGSWRIGLDADAGAMACLNASTKSPKAPGPGLAT